MRILLVLALFAAACGDNVPATSPQTNSAPGGDGGGGATYGEGKMGENPQSTSPAAPPEHGGAK